MAEYRLLGKASFSNKMILNEPSYVSMMYKLLQPTYRFNWAR